MFWTLPYTDSSQASGGFPGIQSAEFEMSQLWLNFNQTSAASSWWGGGGGQVRFYCIIEQSARGASVRRHHHTSVWVHVIVWWLRVDTWHGLDTLGSAATAQTITGSLILIVAPHYSDCLLSQLSHTKAAFMPPHCRASGGMAIFLGVSAAP